METGTEATPKPIGDQAYLSGLRTKVAELENALAAHTEAAQDLKRYKRMLAIAEGTPRKKRRTKEEIIAAGGTVKPRKKN